ncbi:MAG TPA: 5-(carboxyamino)imidazole ribonucleotide synthase [Gammaproteobacteria bacterium]|nr:5-(carboxyamino)imidazole ribonucleotide synthase [Gammaproteobacteria bacterium]
MILPGAMLGMLGGGQLGRMFTVAARTMGYRVLVVDPDPASPAGSIADVHLQAEYQDKAAMQQLVSQCAVVTTEFENIPADVLASLAESIPVRPGASCLRIAQNRIREKTFIKDCGLSTAPFVALTSVDDVDELARQMIFPAILKCAEFGYDGKGQVVVNSVEETRTAFEALGHVPCVLEQKIDLKQEISVVLARGIDGASRCFPIAENTHREGILHQTVVPAAVDGLVEQAAYQMAIQLADALAFEGVMAVEFFISEGNQLLVNEIAPRTHNSGHFTLDACVTSQFEQQVRMVCGLPFGSTRLLSPVVMVNLLGDLWPEQAQPDWHKLLSHPELKLHLYGKHTARKGRKMGHFCLLDRLGVGLSGTAEDLWGLLP